MTKSSNPTESNESAFSEVLVDIPDALMTAAQVEAKRLGVSLEQWIANVLRQALTVE